MTLRPLGIKLGHMRKLVPAVLLFGAACSSEPLAEAPAATGAPAAPAPSAADGDFRPQAVYPAGPYGFGVGSVMENHSFLGWRDPPRAGFDTARFEEVRLGDFYDPSGRELELIVLNASAVWCPACRTEMTEIDRGDLAASYRARGVQIIGTLFQDGGGAPAKPSDLALWGNGITWTVDFPLLLDPGLKLSSYFTSDATPLNLVVDARTMRILRAYMGYGGGLWQFVDAELAARGRLAP